MKNTFTKPIGRLFLILCFLFTGYHVFAGNGNPATTTPVATGRSYAADGSGYAGDGQSIKPDPTSLVSTVVRLNVSPTAASTVTYAVIFDKAVTGVTTSSFGLTTTGSTTGASIASVSGSGTTYIVTVNTGTGDGALRLNVTGTNVLPVTTNVPYTSGQVYTIDRTAPTGSIVINGNAPVTSATTVSLILTATDANPGIQMRLSNDGNSWSAYESLKTNKIWTIPAGDGLKTVYVQYVDASLNMLAYSGSFTLDQTPPETTILPVNANPTNLSYATFILSSSEAGSTFQYSLDGGNYTITGSPLGLNGFTDGSHTVSVRAIDAVGNMDTSPATYTWIVDQTPPAVTAVTGPTDGYYVIGSTMDFVVNYSENVFVNTTGGTPYLNVVLNSGTVQAYYLSGTGTSALTFRYLVADGDGDNNGVNLGATLVNNGSTIRDLLTNDANPALQNVAPFSGVLVNTGRPTAVMTTTAPSVVNHSLTATIRFSEAVSGLSLSDFAVTNAFVTSMATADYITFNVSFAPIADGPVQINVPAAVAVNAAGNPNNASNTLSFTYDAGSPVVTSVSVPADNYYKAGDAMNFTVNFSEPIINNTTGGNPYLTLTIGGSARNATFTSATSTSLTFSYTVVDGENDMDGITVNSLILNGSTLKDAATNNAVLTLNSIGNTANVKVNTIHPTVLLSAPASLVNAPFTTTITFSEIVTGFTIGDMVATNATISNRQTTDDITFTVLVTPTADGPVSLSIPENSALNIAGNGNTAAVAITIQYDITPPAVSSVSAPADGYYKATDVLNFTVNYNENFALNNTGGHPYLNITIGSTVVPATFVGATANQLMFAYTVANGEQDMDGIAVNALVLNGCTLKDAVGNNATVTLNGISNTANVRVNTIRPTVTVSTTAPVNVNVPYTATITFSEVMTGFDITDIAKNNADLSNLHTTDDITYTVLVTPVADGGVSVAVANDVAVNIGNNGNQASNILYVIYDGTPPAVAAVNVPTGGYYKAGSSLNFTVNYTENVEVNTTGGTPFINVMLTTGVVKANYLRGSGTNALVFGYTVVNGDQDMNGIALGTEVQLNGGTLKDAATNNAITTLANVHDLTGVFVNTTYPAVAITTVAYYLVNAPFTATVTFSEAVTGFTTTAITATNATISNLQTTDKITYTVLVTPTAEGAVKLDVPANVAVNIGNNSNTAAPAALNAVYDITQPVVSAVAVPANGYYQAGTTLNFHVKFDSYVFVNTTGGAPYLNISIGSTVVAAQLVDTAGGKGMVNFSYTAQNGELDMDGITVNSLVLNGSTINDMAGNTAILTLNGVGNTSHVLVNTAHPSVTISSAAPAIVNAPFTATITFSEAVTGFTLSDFTTTNATLSQLQPTDNITYTVLVTPLADGNVSVGVPAAVAVNIGSNGNSAAPADVSNFYDATPPVVTSVTVPANGHYTDGNNLNFTVHFSEAVVIDSSVIKPLLQIMIGSATVNAVYTGMPSPTALTFSYTVLPGQMDLDGITIGALSGTIRDMATNDAIRTLGNVGSTANVFVNTGRPAVVLSTVAPARVKTSFPVQIVFSEAVTHFLATDLVVTNGAADNLRTADNITYMADIIPTVDGLVSVSIPAAAAQNSATNPNTASNTLSLTYDITAPVITTGLAFEVSEKAALHHTVGTITASDASGILQDWTITSDDTGGAFSIDNNGVIHVKDTAILRSKRNTVAQVKITVSDGLNTSTPAIVAITIRFVNQAPTLDAISSVVMCTNTDAHTIQLTGASAVETDQTYHFSISADKPNFAALSVSPAGVISYQLEAGVTGITTVTVTIKDNGDTNNGGVDTLRRTFTVTANSLPVISISSDKGMTISKGDIIHLTATGGASYSWDHADGNISGALTDILEAKPMKNTAYNVTVKTAKNCIAAATFSIIVVEDFKVDATNIITPNGDGKNDKWVIKNIDSYPNNEVKIYDRTGRLVYTRRNYNNEWDATINGTPLGEGTYYYILTIQGGKTAKGYITIIRDQR